MEIATILFRHGFFTLSFFFYDYFLFVCAADFAQWFDGIHFGTWWWYAAILVGVNLELNFASERLECKLSWIESSSSLNRICRKKKKRTFSSPLFFCWVAQFSCRKWRNFRWKHRQTKQRTNEWANERVHARKRSTCSQKLHYSNKIQAAAAAVAAKVVVEIVTPMKAHCGARHSNVHQSTLHSLQRFEINSNI